MTTTAPATAAPFLAPFAALCALVGLAVGCAGPPMASPIEGETVCPDFELGQARLRMRGALRYPVQLVVRDDGDVVAKTVLVGLPPGSPATRIVLPDVNADYDLEWGVCENERASFVASLDKNPKVTEGVKYECGKATVYKTTKHSTKRGDRSTHTLRFEPPPSPECHVSTVPSALPSALPSSPTSAPPSAAPVGSPTGAATGAPSAEPTAAPTAGASAPPATAAASASPSVAPTARP
jgi:hypothetical protein